MNQETRSQREILRSIVDLLMEVPRQWERQLDGTWITRINNIIYLVDAKFLSVRRIGEKYDQALSGGEAGRLYSSLENPYQAGRSVSRATLLAEAERNLI